MKMNLLKVIFGFLLITGFSGLKAQTNSAPKGNEDIYTPSIYGTYYDAKRSFFESLPNDTNEIIFLGNSITDMCAWNELFGMENVKNRGISGDVINGIINRLDEVVSSNPKKIFLMIGTNDLARKRSIDQILTDYEKLITLIIQKTPKTQLYLQSILPTQNQATRNNNDIIQINKGIQELAKKYSLIYINLFDLFKTNENELNMNYSRDGLHLNGKGYLLWKDAVIEYVVN
ncbi:MAG: GDSL-type esterase/lipase family protein [Bacteroidales bacterium]